MEAHQYGATGFVPTVTEVSYEGDTLVLETLDPRDETDLIGEPGKDLQRQGDLVTDEQQDQLALYERN
jgi:hypothetical protein